MVRALQLVPLLVLTYAPNEAIAVMRLPLLLMARATHLLVNNLLGNFMLPVMFDNGKADHVVPESVEMDGMP